MLQNAIEETKQFHQEFVRNVLKKFCCQTTFVTGFVDLQTGTRTFQFSKGPVCLCLCGWSVREEIVARKDSLQSISKLVQWWLAVKPRPVLHLYESYCAMPSNEKLDPTTVSTGNSSKNGSLGDAVS